MPSLNRRWVTTSTPALLNCIPTPTDSFIKSKIFKTLWEMKKRGLAEQTLSNTSKLLTFLSKHSNLDDSEDVKGFIARLDRKNGYKRNLVYAYNNYAKVHNIVWDKPKYYASSKLPKIPSEEKINMIIANCSKKLALALSISRDTGMRPIEVMNLRLRDIDIKNALAYPNTAKHGTARVLKLKSSTINMLVSYLAKHQEIGINDTIFDGWNGSKYGKWFRHYRNKLAKKLSDTSLKEITLYSLRHFYATRLYHRTKDILLVKQKLGHRKIETTLIYTQLVNFSEEDEFHSATATTVEEARNLIETGFEYVTEFEGVKLLRKRK